jgi:hypothetical protein
MKKSLIILSSFFIISCGSVNRKVFGNTEKDLIKQVSIETGCSSDKITVTEKIQNLGNATYALNVCGNRMVYKQIGSVFMKSEELDKLLNKK